MVPIEVFGKALDRAIDEGLRIRPAGVRPGHFDVSSGSDPEKWYRAVSVSWCGCQAARGGTFCKHRALVAYVTNRVEDLVGRVAYDHEATNETLMEVLER